jgi:hypothetical protein
MTKRRPSDAVQSNNYEYIPRIIAGEVVHIAVPLPEVPLLTQRQKDTIVQESGINFLSDTDWDHIHLALHRYALDVRRSREGDYDEICAKLKRIKDCALAFIESVTYKNATDTLAINWLYKVAGEEIYGRISAVVAETARRVEKTLEDIQQERLLPNPDPLGGLVEVVQNVFGARGVDCRFPKAKDHAEPRPSQAQRFIWSLLSKLPKEFQPDNIGIAPTAAFQADTARAHRRKKTGRSS